MRSRIRIQTPAPQPAPCLFATGPVRAVMDHKKGNILVETTADHPQGKGLVVCRVPKDRMAEARAIVALSDLIRAAPPFAALGRCLAEQDPEQRLIANAVAGLDLTAGDLQAMAAALDRALGPAGSFQRAAPARQPRAAAFRP